MPEYHQITCECGYKMQVETQHFGATNECPQCGCAVHVTRANVDTRMGDAEEEVAFGPSTDDGIPVEWKIGDVLLQQKGWKGPNGSLTAARGTSS